MIKPVSAIMIYSDLAHEEQKCRQMNATKAWLGMHRALTSNANDSHPGGRFAVKLRSQLAGCSFKIRDYNDGDFCVSVIPLAEVLFAKDSCGA